jgi:hypothetical protein
MTKVPAAVPRRTFVLVHGTSHGGWAWRRVADLLQARGHKVYTPTLTGLADRSHLMSGAINLDTHIFDVVNLIKWEGLDDVCLVGQLCADQGRSVVADVRSPLRPRRPGRYAAAACRHSGGSGVIDAEAECIK